MDLTYHHTVTAAGLDATAWLSGLQKSIRRGMVREAVWATGEACAFLAVEQGRARVALPADPKAQVTRAKSVVTNVLHRLLVIYLEDVHAGEPSLWRWVEARVRQLIALRARPAAHGEFGALLAEAAAALCAARHSRFYSHVRRATDPAVDAAWTRPRGLAPELEPVLAHLAANDQDQTHNHNPRYEAGAGAEAGVDIAWWHKHLPQRERWLLGAALSVHGALLRGAGDRAAEIGAQARDAAAAALAAPPDGVPAFFRSDAVLDAHTAEGRRLTGALGMRRFVLLGTRVSAERLLLPPAYEAYYVAARLGLGPPPLALGALLDREPLAAETLASGRGSERLLLRFEARAQLTCSHARPDTYFARLWGVPVFVKGPYLAGPDAAAAERQLWVHALKRRLEGLRALRPFACRLLPDAFDGGVPVGTRRKTTPDRAHLFMLWDSLLPADRWPVPTTVRSGEAWPATAVVDWGALGDAAGAPEPARMDGPALRALLLACAWRRCGTTRCATLCTWVRARARPSCTASTRT